MTNILMKQSKNITSNLIEKLELVVSREELRQLKEAAPVFKLRKDPNIGWILTNDSNKDQVLAEFGAHKEGEIIGQLVVDSLNRVLSLSRCTEVLAATIQDLDDLKMASVQNNVSAAQEIMTGLLASIELFRISQFKVIQANLGN